MRVQVQAKIVFGDVMIHCEVRDISTGGARIAVKGHIYLPETFELFICAEALRVYPAQVRWRCGDFAGVLFDVSKNAAAVPMDYEPVGLGYKTRHLAKPFS